MSSPATAGGVALLLEANPLLSPLQIKNILKLTARQDSRTGVINSPGSTEWGMGKVTASDAIQMALSTVSIGEEKSNNLLTLFPNPVHNELTLRLNEPLESGIGYDVYTIDGKIITSGMLSKTKVLNVNNWQSGIYFVIVKTSKKRAVLKFIKD